MADTPAPARAYHHGDLRRALLTAALDEIAAGGPDAVSLRALARRAGVSHAAPAHHFGDRPGLLTAIATEGFDLLAQELSEADGLREAGARYVRFAVRHRAYFQVMFRPELLHTGDPALVTARSHASAALGAGITGLPPQNRGADARTAGIAAWSLAHGFATLLLARNLTEPVGGQDPEEYFRLLADLLFQGGGNSNGNSDGDSDSDSDSDSD
ncbi:TetR/AcrR family transcriptional regulator [Streptomyces sp. NPDC050095]|uniref:TetR/AcrR family transcriptional regulator n=1 Tax=unclassified Streptomyces TaxID=2593676 RepID=UPI0034291ACB